MVIGSLFCHASFGICQALSNIKDYHKNMDGDAFEQWLDKRLIPAFEALYPGKKMILIMDNASYHHQLSTEFYPKGVTPKTASKGQNAHVLRMLGIRSIKIVIKGVEMNFEVPEEEPRNFADHRLGVAGAKAPTSGESGTVYCRAGPGGGPSSKELANAVLKLGKTTHPQILDSRVERMFKEKGWKIIWTPPYCPKFQPIELVWGMGKQRAAALHSKGRNLKTTREHLRRGWYGGESNGTKPFDPCNVRKCWETALVEMKRWIAADLEHNPGDNGRPKGLTGELGRLGGVAGWTQTEPTCTDIDDIDVGDGTDIDHVLGEEAENVLQGDIQVAAAYLGGGDVETLHGGL